jgi:CRP-like cAMP-binding protein/CheY-like chemotaxis protein
MGAKILVVEDEDAVAQDIIECLTEFGYEIVGRASSADGAIDLTNEEEPDLVLMDIKLEGERDGIDAAEVIRGKGVPIIFLTAFTDSKTLERAKITEPFGYLVKPYKEIDLRTTIEVALQHSSSTVPDGSTKTAVPAPTQEVDQKTYKLLRSVKQFAPLPDEEIEFLASHAKRKAHEPGELVIVEGEIEPRGFIVESGRVAFLKSSAEGKDLIVEILPPGDVFGLLVPLNKQPYPYSTKVQIESSLLWIPRAPVYQILDRHPKLSRTFFEDVFSRLRESHGFSRLLAHEKVEVRVAAVLLSLLPNVSSENGQRQKIQVTRQELADITGTTQETCIRVTRALEKKGVLDLTENKLIGIVDTEKLQELAGV